MQRPAGVVISAVLLVLLSLLQLLMAGLMALAGLVPPHASVAHAGAAAVAPAPPWMPIFMYALAAFFLVLTVWGIATVVGLMKLRRWARYSILVIGGGMALLGLFSMLSILVMAFIPLPTPPTADPSQAHVTRAAVTLMLGVIGVFYAALLALGVFWLVYFNRRAVRMAFDQAQGQPAESRRPFLIALFAVLQMLGAPVCLVLALLPLPALILGFALHGWEKAMVYVVFSALQIVGAIGLWRLEEWGRRLTMAFLAFGIVNCMVIVMRPSLVTRYGAEINQALHLAQQSQVPSRFQTIMSVGSSCTSILLFLATIAVLHHYRGKFGRIFGAPDESAALS
ncbi:MAG TPA: hypothetical protein VFB43_15965 [Terracidiphilus sp.]|nr:hypothetical protein [Terracidiphilus sp.]